MYGLGLPILFPVAVFTFTILYFMEKTLIYYSFRQPPMYDDKLNKSVLSIMQFAPLLFLCFGYWMYSNKQLLSNDNIVYVERDNDPQPSHHIWYNAFQGKYFMSPAMPLYITFWLLLVLLVLRGLIYKICVKMCRDYVRIGDAKVDENLDNYFNNLDDSDRNWSIKEEENARNVLKMKVLDDETFQRLKSTK